MWEAYGLENEDFLWAGTVFQGGIAGQQQAPCGAVSAGAVALGLRHRCPPGDKEEADRARKAAYGDARELVESFIEKFGAISCIELVGVDFSDEKARERARELRVFESKCEKYVQYVIEKLYELEEKRSADKTP